MGRAPGQVRDSIVRYLDVLGRDATLQEITAGVIEELGEVSSSSVRSYLNLNVPRIFKRVKRGRYDLASRNGFTESADCYRAEEDLPAQVVRAGLATLHCADCFEWLDDQKPESFHACVTDPPYGLIEYSDKEQSKLVNGNRGGIWRIPPSFDGHKRSPLPRFTVLTNEDRTALFAFFRRFGSCVKRVLVPGANVVVASNPLLSHIVASAMAEAGLEVRGTLIRLTMTMRGGDRPKNAHEEFASVSVMPRSMFEPWVVLRRPLEGRVQDNLRKWKTGGFRRLSPDRPFGDVIRSRPTSAAERRIAPHPSLKPQEFLRKLVAGVLPLGEGIVLDPFAGSGSTLASANAIVFRSVCVELRARYVDLARIAIPQLGRLDAIDPVLPELLDAQFA
jgi:site-specific DNA-methyltransferase (adenine-specific)